jgi:hypothetical protein
MLKFLKSGMVLASFCGQVALAQGDLSCTFPKGKLEMINNHFSVTQMGKQSVFDFNKESTERVKIKVSTQVNATTPLSDFATQRYEYNSDQRYFSLSLNFAAPERSEIILLNSQTGLTDRFNAVCRISPSLNSNLSSVFQKAQALQRQSVRQNPPQYVRPRQVCTRYEPSNGYSNQRCVQYGNVDSNGRYCAEYRPTGGYQRQCARYEDTCVERSSTPYRTCVRYRAE